MRKINDNEKNKIFAHNIEQGHVCLVLAVFNNR